MGIAGSGKGTQGKLLATSRGYHIISTGELLRNYGSDDQHARMVEGEILGDEEVTALLDKALSHLEDQNNTILDGYPRTVSQAKWLLENEQKKRFKINFVVHLKASREAVKQRLHDRGRADDNDEAIEARFREYEQATLPILELLRARGIEIVEIDGQKPIEEVHQQIVQTDRAHKQEA